MMPPNEMPHDTMPIAMPRRLKKWRGTTRYTVVVDMPAEIAEEKGGRLTSYCSRIMTLKMMKKWVSEHKTIHQ